MAAEVELPAAPWLGHDPERGDLHGFSHDEVRAIVAQATAAKDAQIEAAMVLILRSDAECLVRDHERFSTTGSSTVGGRLAAKRVRSLLAGQQQENGND